MRNGTNRCGAGGTLTRRWRYRVARTRRAIGRFADLLDSDLASTGVPTDVRGTLATVLDELLANVLMHADSARGPVHVHLRKCGGELTARLRYLASPFDPTSLAAPQVAASIAQARVGGAGIAMVRALTREFAWCHRRGENRLRVRVG